jgi:diacylglycerol kinase family enzyme
VHSSSARSAAPARPHRGRIAAWIALLAAAAVVVALVFLVIRDWRALLLALAALTLAGGAAWIAVTRRGALRAIALVCAVCALIGGAVALVLLDVIDELIALALAIGVFGIATTKALTAAANAETFVGESTTSRPRPVGGRERAVLIMNPKSGGGKVALFDLPNEAKKRGITPVVLSPGDDLRELARDAVRSADVVGMAGGDGSQALVAQVAMEHDVAYVCIPAGTRNHLALDLGLDRSDVVGALDGFTDGIDRPIDLAFVNDRIFVNNVSLGVYAEIVQSDAYRNAKLETTEQMLPELLGPRAQPFDLRFAGPNGGAQRSAQLLLVSNNPYVLNRLVGMGSRPRMDTGNLGIIAIEIANARGAMELMALEATGQVRRFEGWLEWSAPEFEVSSGSPVAAGVDGEALVMDPPLRFRIAPAALHVRLPPSAPGLSPAARRPALSGSAVSELWKVATARR